MQIPLQVTFRGIDSSPAMEQRIREHRAVVAGQGLRFCKTAGRAGDLISP